MGAAVNGMALAKLQAVRLRLPDLLRLYAQSDPAIGDHGAAGPLHLHTRFDRRRRGRTDTSAGRTNRRAARRAGAITFAPADADEVAEAGAPPEVKHQPACLILSRQPLPTLDRSRFAPASGVGAWRLCAGGSRSASRVILIGTGSEVSLCIAAAEQLAARVPTRVVSMPSWELFEQQDEAYRRRCCRTALSARVAVEQAATIGWERYVGRRGAIVGMHTFGASARSRGCSRSSASPRITSSVSPASSSRSTAARA